MDETIIDRLINQITQAARASFTSLFKNGEHFYYCTLLTSGDGLAPYMSAWSIEALDNQASEDREYIKWSYADSPYCAWEFENFSDVQELIDGEEFNKYINKSNVDKSDIIMEAMFKSMSTLEQEGLFSRNQNRDDVVVLAEFMPPDNSNTKRAYLLNDRQNQTFKKWLEEIAE